MGAASTKNVFAEIVQTLLSKDIDSTEHDFWDELWKTVLSGLFRIKNISQYFCLYTYSLFYHVIPLFFNLVLRITLSSSIFTC